MHCPNCGYTMDIMEMLPLKKGIHEVVYTEYKCGHCELIVQRTTRYHDDAIGADFFKIDWSDTSK